MKIRKILIPLLLVLCLSAALVAGCRKTSESQTTAQDQIVTVQRGDITLDITAAGNLALSDVEDLAFDIAGTVEEVLVEEGDVVEEGQVLAKLDTSEWEDNIEVLEDAVTSAQRSLAQAQINLITAEQTLKNTRDTQATKELALLNAQISLNSAQYNLGVAERTIVPDEAQYAQEAVDDAKAALETLIQRVEEAETDEARDAWLSMVPAAQSNLRSAYSMLYALIGEYESEQIDIKRQQAEAALMSLVQAHEDLNDVAQDIALKELQLTLTQGKLEDAEKAVRDAQEALEEAKDKSPLIIAPFDGFITMVNVEGGDEVLRGTVAVQIADPNKFEADILVSEMDILQVTLGMPASVEVDAAQGMSFPASVTHISPTATIQQGVVNYQVRVELESLAPQEPTASAARPSVDLERLFEVFDKAVQDGKLTQEEADAWKKGYQDRASSLTQEQVDQSAERMAQLFQNYTREQLKQFQERMQQAAEQLTEEQKQQLRERYAQASAAGQQQSAMLQQGTIQLREGLTVTVSIVLQQRTNVLMVPNKAIISRQGKTFVQVMKDGVTEERPVSIGLSGWQNTEIIEGLSEGEQVLLPQSTNTTSTQQQPAGFFGGMRR